MPRTAERTNGFDAEIKEIMGSNTATREAAIQSWSEACELYSRYFAALSRAKTASELLAANTEFVTQGMEVMTHSVAAARKLNGAAKPAA